MAEKIILSSDSVCDLGPELKRKYNVQYYYFHIQIDGKSYIDTEDITSDEIYAIWRKQKLLPKTAAITPKEYYDYFKRFTDDGRQVVHVNLGSALSSSYANAAAAARELPGVYAVDSAAVSTGVGLMVLKAGEMIQSGMDAPDISEILAASRTKIRGSFLLDTLEFVRAGGRCAGITAFGAALLNLKPCVEVNQHGGGALNVGKKYHGSMEKVLAKYVNDKLSRGGMDLEHVFITHSGCPEGDIELVRAEMAKLAHFRNVYVTRAGTTISCHSGPGALGLMFMDR